MTPRASTARRFRPRSGTPYTFAFTNITGSPTPTFKLRHAAVNGITISPAGVLSGTPKYAGKFKLTVVAANGVEPKAEKTFTLVVASVTHEPHDIPPCFRWNGFHNKPGLWIWVAHHLRKGDFWTGRCLPIPRPHAKH